MPNSGIVHIRGEYEVTSPERVIGWLDDHLWYSDHPIPGPYAFTLKVLYAMEDHCHFQEFPQWGWLFQLPFGVSLVMEGEYGFELAERRKECIGSEPF